MALAPHLDFEAFVASKKAHKAEQAAKQERAPEPEPAREPAVDPRGYAYRLDRVSRQAFDSARPIAIAVEASIRLFKRLGQKQLLGHGVKVSERQLPRIHAIVKSASAALGIAVPDVFIVNSPTLNAATFGTNDESFIVLHSALVESYSDDELLAVVGHECGHIQNAHVAYLTALHYLTYMAGMLLPWVLQPALIGLRAWSRRAEITCDRAAMLACKDAKVAERAVAKLALGSSELYREFDVDAFLEQYGESSTGVGRYLEAFSTHPWLPKRILAMRVFAQSRMFQEAAGGAGEGLSLDEVDARVAALLKGEA